MLAANPCPCGFSGVNGKECTCAPLTVRRYQERLSGPVMDRIDIRHHMLPVRQSLVVTPGSSPESSSSIADRMAEARARQRRRLTGTPWRTNGEVPGPHLRRELPLPVEISPLKKTLARGQLSARGVDKVLRLAWTVADLAEEDRISINSLRVAMSMRLGTLGRAA